MKQDPSTGKVKKEEGKGEKLYATAGGKFARGRACAPAFCPASCALLCIVEGTVAHTPSLPSKQPPSASRT